MKALESIGDRETLGELFAEHGVILAYRFGSQADEKAGARAHFDVAALRRYLNTARPRRFQYRALLERVEECRTAMGES